MLHLVHRATITTTCKTKASCKSKFTSQESSLDPVPSSICAHNAQEINTTNCDVTTWTWSAELGMGTVGELSEPLAIFGGACTSGLT